MITKLIMFLLSHGYTVSYSKETKMILVSCPFGFEITNKAHFLACLEDNLIDFPCDDKHSITAEIFLSESFRVSINKKG